MMNKTEALLEYVAYSENSMCARKSLPFKNDGIGNPASCARRYNETSALTERPRT